MAMFPLELLRSRVTDAAWQWLESERSLIRGGVTAARLSQAYTTAARRLGKQPLDLTDGERAAVAARDPDLSLAQWDVTDLGRLTLLEALFEGGLPVDAASALAIETFETADAREQQSWLRGVSLLPHNDRYVLTAIDACRTNILPLFESIACENPFPMRRFPELNFNQMVLKAFFNAVAVARIVGLERRLNPELSRMAADYVSERKAAGRSVPPDIGLVLHGSGGVGRTPLEEPVS